MLLKTNYYSLIFKKLQALLGNENVYPYLPLEDVKYPFAVFSDEEEKIDLLKTYFVSETEYVFDLWSRNKRELKEITEEMRTFLIKLRAQDLNIRFKVDDSTNELLERVVFSFKIKNY